jgi:YidC/Oxa1 family membrane protein insertase
LLGAALMFVVFLLWQNWLEFQAKKHPPPTPPVATAPAGSLVSTSGALPPSPGQDVPTAAPAVRCGPQALGGGQRVQVTTDLFAIEIDTVGGDLRRVGLRTYPDSVQQPDQPFALLKDTGGDFLSPSLVWWR